jgi:lysophospholipase L1-like esterase
MKQRIFIFSLLALMAFATPPKKKITIWMCGDSTMSIKETKAYPETGWGMPFVNFWDSTVTVVNKAKNGRSTQSFIDEGLWKSVTDNLKEDDYVFIQFAHNDEVPSKKTYTTPEQFRNNLIKYVTETKQKKAIPVLLTPVARRKFDSTGRIIDTHEAYAQIIREVAKANNVYIIDMSEKSMALLQIMGPAASAYLFNHLVAGEHPNYPEGKIDDTHFSELGARKMAELALAEIRNLKLELTDHIVMRSTK